MAQNPDLDEKTGDYVLEGGKPKETDSLRIPAYIRLKVRRGTWMYSPDIGYGSDFHSIKKRVTASNDARRVEDAAARALQPLVTTARASRIDITLAGLDRHATALNVKIIEENGRLDELNIPGIGV